MKKVLSFFETWGMAVAAHRLHQLGYHDEAKRIMIDNAR